MSILDSLIFNTVDYYLLNGEKITHGHGKGSGIPGPLPSGHPSDHESVAHRIIGGSKALYQGTKEAINKTGSKVWDRLPSKVQKALSTSHAIYKWIEHKLEIPYKGTQNLVKEVMKERGLDQSHIDKVSKICAVADGISRWTHNIPLAHTAIHALDIATGGSAIALSKAAFYVPIGSLAYLSYSAARNPLATLRAAKSLVSGKMKEVMSQHRIAHNFLVEISEGIEYSNVPYVFNKSADQHKEVITRLTNSINESRDPDLFMALVLSALDELKISNYNDDSDDLLDKALHIAEIIEEEDSDDNYPESSPPVTNILVDNKFVAKTVRGGHGKGSGIPGPLPWAVHPVTLSKKLNKGDKVFHNGEEHTVTKPGGWRNGHKIELQDTKGNKKVIDNPYVHDDRPTNVNHIPTPNSPDKIAVGDHITYKGKEHQVIKIATANDPWYMLKDKNGNTRQLLKESIDQDAKGPIKSNPTTAAKDQQYPHAIPMGIPTDPSKVTVGPTSGSKQGENAKVRYAKDNPNAESVLKSKRLGTLDAEGNVNKKPLTPPPNSSAPKPAPNSDSTQQSAPSTQPVKPSNTIQTRGSTSSQKPISTKTLPNKSSNKDNNIIDAEYDTPVPQIGHEKSNRLGNTPKNTTPQIGNKPNPQQLLGYKPPVPQIGHEEHKNEQEQHGPPKPGRSDRRTSLPVLEGYATDSGPMAGTIIKSNDATGNSKRDTHTQPSSAGSSQNIPPTTEQVNSRIDRFANVFRNKGNHEVAGWLDKLKDHVNKVGTDEALKQLGEAKTGTGEKVNYAGGFDSMSHFTQAYLEKNGISLSHVLDDREGGTGSYTNIGVKSDRKTISTLPFSPDYIHKTGNKGDIAPGAPKYKNKLAEAKLLPGLETSEDFHKVVGKDATHFTPEVISKLDEKYGKGQWIVKAYGDYAFAGFGIFFPQRVQQIHEDAKNTIWNTGSQLSQYGFSHLRDESGKIVGIKHEGGDEYKFGTKHYEDTIHGHARELGDQTQKASDSEHATSLPADPIGGRKYMVQPAFPVLGVSDADRAAGRTHEGTGEGRVHIICKNGVAQAIPGTTWIKGEHLPVVFETEHTKAMAKAAVDAINAMPAQHRKNQMYSPDVVRTANGYKVVEANPSETNGGSGYLGDNPFIMDSYVAHLTGREPAHVKFIRNVLSSTKTLTGENSANLAGIGNVPTRENISSGKTGSDKRETGLSRADTRTKTRRDSKQPKDDTTPKGFSDKLKKAGVSELIEPGGDRQRFQQPVTLQTKHNNEVLDAAKSTGKFIKPENLPSAVKNSPNIGGMEHDVHHDPESDRFFKLTKDGHFGQNKDIHEYTQRHEIANKLWPELDYKFHGITKDAKGNPQSVLSMARVAGTHPEQHEITNWFKSNGWKSNEDSSEEHPWSWKDPKSGTVINDAHTKNFIKTSKGLVPIDVDIIPGRRMPSVPKPSKVKEESPTTNRYINHLKLAITVDDGLRGMI